MVHSKFQTQARTALGFYWKINRTNYHVYYIFITFVYLKIHPPVHHTSSFINDSLKSLIPRWNLFQWGLLQVKAVFTHELYSSGKFLQILKWWNTSLLCCIMRIILIIFISLIHSPNVSFTLISQIKQRKDNPPVMELKDSAVFNGGKLYVVTSNPEGRGCSRCFKVWVISCYTCETCLQKIEKQQSDDV